MTFISLVKLSTKLLGCLSCLCAQAVGSFQLVANEPAYVGFDFEGLPTTTSLYNVEAETGWPAQFALFFLQWPAPGQPTFFPKNALSSIWQHGSVPCLTWEPMYIESGGMKQNISFQAILNGAYDTYLDSFAAQAAKFGKRFIIRFAHEMNLQSYHWGTEEALYGPATPALYASTFRYIVNRFRLRGATNVLWAFCPNCDSVPNAYSNPPAAWNTASAYYPGNCYVDILGMDGYNWGTRLIGDWQSTWRTFNDIFWFIFQELRSLSPTKPLVVFETASVWDYDPQEQTVWVHNAVQTCQDWGIKALLWFHVNKELDWRLLHQDQPPPSPTTTPRRWVLDLVLDRCQ